MEKDRNLRFYHHRDQVHLLCVSFWNMSNAVGISISDKVGFFAFETKAIRE